MKKRENFYRRDPGLALAGMAGMTLEERGVYNTILDLLYLTWRPVEDNAAYIAGHCGCAVQKLNPIISRLIEKRKLIRFVEGGQSYISNPAFEAERDDVKGPAKSRSGRRQTGENEAEVEEKSPGVEEKSASVSQNPPLLDIDVEEKQPVTALDRQEKSREEPPTSPKGDGEFELVPEEPAGVDDVSLAYELWNVMAKSNDLPLARVLDAGRRRAIRKRLDDGGLDAWTRAVDAVSRSPHCRGENDRKWRADIDFVCQPKSWRRLLEGTYGDGAKPAPSAQPMAPEDPTAVWKRRIEEYRKNTYWNRLDWGPPPGKPGCKLAAEIVMACGYMPAPVETGVAA